MTKTILGIIGGSGVYDIAMDNARWQRIEIGRASCRERVLQVV